MPSVDLQNLRKIRQSRIKDFMFGYIRNDKSVKDKGIPMRLFIVAYNFQLDYGDVQRMHSLLWIQVKHDSAMIFQRRKS